MSVDTFELIKQEYLKIKDEQIKRIGFRDNLLYVNLVLISGVFSFVFASDKGAGPNQWHFYGLLLVGWVTLVLGWTYLVNDEKISSIGRYIRYNLAPALDSEPSSTLFGWEVAHRSDPRRLRRKIEQLVIDELSFVVIGIVAIILFWAFASNYGAWTIIISVAELGLLLGLGWEIFVYADFGRGR